MVEPRQLAGLTAMALVGTSRVTRAPAAEFYQSRALLIGILQSSVEDARVDYAGLKAHPQDLNRYLDRVAVVATADLKQRTESKQTLSDDAKARS